MTAPRRKPVPARRARSKGAGGKLRIGDNWNVIRIIALSQGNPLKAIAEFVENSIDARAASITIIRGRERGEAYLKIVDDGEGIPPDASGVPDFTYVATHIGDSLKRTLKEKGAQGIQGEFGIGLLSFWTVGESLTLSCAGPDGRTWQMGMRKNEPGFSITARRTLFSHRGTELLIRPLLPGLRQLSGEKIQNYLASELRDRIRRSGVRIRILDRGAKKDLEVQPRQYAGRLLHELSSLPTDRGEVYLELYLTTHAPENRVALFRAGTRVLASLAEIEALDHEPWSSGFLQGMVDAPFLQLTPGTRSGIIHDESFECLCAALETVRAPLLAIIDREKQAEEEQASRTILKSVQKAFKEAFLALPPEDYGWFDLHTGSRGSRRCDAARGGANAVAGEATGDQTEEAVDPLATGAAAAGSPAAMADAGERREEREFYSYPGPLFSAIVSPSSAVMKVGTERGFRCIARDRTRRLIEEGLTVRWRIAEGEGRLSADSGEIVTFTAPQEPGLCILEATVTQGDAVLSARAVVTVSETLIDRGEGAGEKGGKGLPGYTFLRKPGELWRSRYDERNNLVVVNNGHRDYLYADQKQARKLKYISPASTAGSCWSAWSSCLSTRRRTCGSRPCRRLTAGRACTTMTGSEHGHGIALAPAWEGRRDRAHRDFGIPRCRGNLSVRVRDRRTVTPGGRCRYRDRLSGCLREGRGLPGPVGIEVQAGGCRSSSR